MIQTDIFLDMSCTADFFLHFNSLHWLGIWGFLHKRSSHCKLELVQFVNSFNILLECPGIYDQLGEIVIVCTLFLLFIVILWNVYHHKGWTSMCCFFSVPCTVLHDELLFIHQGAFSMSVCMKCACGIIPWLFELK